MNEVEITQYIHDTLEPSYTQMADDNYFYFYGEDRMFPFATLVTKNDYDTASDLDRLGVFRLNMGVSKATFLSLFGEKMSRDDEENAKRFDFKALDTLIPNPVYGRMFWVAILNPSDETFHSVVKGLLAEAYERAEKRNKSGSTTRTDPEEEGEW